MSGAWLSTVFIEGSKIASHGRYGLEHAASSCGAAAEDCMRRWLSFNGAMSGLFMFFQHTVRLQLDLPPRPDSGNQTLREGMPEMTSIPAADECNDIVMS